MLHNEINAAATPSAPDVMGVQTERYLKERMERTLKRKSESKELTYEFTRDEGYLHQYYLLRSQLIGRQWGWSLPAQKDDYDDASHIIIARKGNQVVGGGRIIIRSPRVPRPLLMETGEFSLIDALPELGLVNKKYCEFSRFVLLEEYQQSLVALDIFYRLYQKYKSLGVEYGFAALARPSVRVYRRFCSALGLHYTVRNDIELPDRPHREGLPMTLVVFDDEEIGNLPHQRYGVISKKEAEPV